jgi:pullulanase/glycogen debranching enzyme
MSPPAASTSASSRSGRRESISFCSIASTTSTTGSRHGSFGLDPVTNRTYHYRHVFVPGVRAGQIYGFRVYGPFDPSRGYRFDSGKVLLDPYGRAVVVPVGYNRAAAHEKGDNAAAAMKSVVVDPAAYDWEGDRPLHRPASQTVVYEMHVRGFTRHPSSGLAEETRGTYAGLIDKIPYLTDLGITAVELLPVFQFDALDCPAGHVNYWGYAPVSFFAPHQAYSSRQDPLGPVDEFRDMVKALHRAGIEVILDVVFKAVDRRARRTGICVTRCAGQICRRLQRALQGKHANRRSDAVGRRIDRHARQRRGRKGPPHRRTENPRAAVADAVRRPRTRLPIHC